MYNKSNLAEKHKKIISYPGSTVAFVAEVLYLLFSANDDKYESIYLIKCSRNRTHNVISG